MHYKYNKYYYLEKGILDYNKITKLQRCNSYLENYNKISKSTLGTISNLSWPQFITIIKKKELYYTKKVIEIEKSRSRDTIIM